jgi:DNA adenine methylase
MENTFLKWAGGKNWFTRHHNQRLPHVYNRYIDPFLGGGSVYFYMEPPQAILSDINQELITTYQAIGDDWRAVERNLRNHNIHHNRDYYYAVRGMRPRTPATIAARMIYLNRTCFNGIYRVNRNGGFNVPIGTHNRVILDTDRYEERSWLLQNAEIVCRDFEITIDLAAEGDFLFCDPPYSVLDENHRFVGYTGELFDWNAQIRLSQALHRAKDRGAQILMTNVNHEEVRALYQDIEGYRLEDVNRYSSISGLAGGRQQYNELIISANII